jgi:ribonuclease HI
VERLRTVDVFVAGVCDGVSAPGGWGAVLRHGRHRRELHGAEPVPTTADRMLLTAAAEALDRLTGPVAARLHAVQPGGRHADLRSRLTIAGETHHVTWLGVTGPDPDGERADELARDGLLEAARILDARCVHDLITSQCWQCRPKAGDRPDRVAITSGGAVFHLSEACRALRDGWRHVERRGGIRSDLTWVPTVDALTAGREQCEVCCAGRDIR